MPLLRILTLSEICYSPSLIDQSAAGDPLVTWLRFVPGLEQLSLMSFEGVSFTPLLQSLLNEGLLPSLQHLRIEEIIQSVSDELLDRFAVPSVRVPRMQCLTYRCSTAAAGGPKHLHSSFGECGVNYKGPTSHGETLKCTLAHLLITN